MRKLSDLRARLQDPAWLAEAFGSSESTLWNKQPLVSAVLDSFQGSFSHSGTAAVVACFVPGRLEFLGKHTDYAGGSSLLAAVDRGFFCIAAKNHSRRVRLVEVDPRYAPAEFDISPALAPVAGHWSNYPMTMVQRLAANFGSALELEQAGVDVAFGSDLPVAAGLSGSSALMIMTFYALALPNRLMQCELFTRNIRNPIDLATYLACVENGQTFRELQGGRGVGTFGGSEDHTCILHARPGMLSQFSFCPTMHELDIPFPEQWTLLVAHSGVQAEKTREAKERYNLVSRRARLAVERYNELWGTEHQLLRDVAAEAFTSPERWAQTAQGLAKVDVALDLFGRLNQFAQEHGELIPAAVTAIRDRQAVALGDITDRSHALSRLALGNIAPEVDCLQRAARELGAVAASGFGAGFGGSAYAVVPTEEASSFGARWKAAYLQRFPERAPWCEFFATKPSRRAGEL